MGGPQTRLESKFKKCFKKFNSFQIKKKFEFDSLNCSPIL